MALGPLLRAALLCTVVFAVLAAAVRASAQPDDTLRAALLPPQGCPAPCWMGIQPGLTTGDEAEAILRQHPWVSSVHRTALNISWRWTGAQHPAIAPDAQGLIYLRGERSPRVVTLRIALNTRFGDAWALFGAPQAAQLLRPSRNTAYLLASFDHVGVQVISSMACPSLPDTYWNGQLSLHLGELTFTEVMNSSPYNVFEQSGWWRWMVPCRRMAGL